MMRTDSGLFWGALPFWLCCAVRGRCGAAQIFTEYGVLPRGDRVNPHARPRALKDLFRTIESTAIAKGDQKKGRGKPMRETLWDCAAYAAMTHTDADYFRIMVHVIFYSGMKAAIVTRKLPAIDKHFTSYSLVAGYGEQDISTTRRNSLPKSTRMAPSRPTCAASQP